MASPRIAEDLANANAGDLIHVDEKGRVRGRARVRSIQAIYWGALLALLTLEGVLGYGLLGAPGLGFVFGLTLLVGWRFSKQRALKLALDAAAEKRYAEADRRLTALERARVLPRLFRPVVVSQRAGIQERLGDHEAALRLCREAQRLFGASRRVHAQLARLQEVRLLAHLGHVEEARARYAELGPLPDGEIFRLHRDTLELYLAFREGAHALSDEELHDRASFALDINLAVPLLGLLAWAFDQRGDAEMTELLRETALERDADDAAQRYPALFDWLEGRSDAGSEGAARARAIDGAADEADDREALEPAENEHARRRLRSRG